jgi:uncharacterized protein YceK
MKNITLMLTVFLSGCAYSITDVDVSKAEPTSVRQCSTTYSLCVSSGNQIGFKTETLRACRESYQVCVNTCPQKN